jgi:CRP-like cAMP-binding protein
MPVARPQPQTYVDPDHRGYGGLGALDQTGTLLQFVQNQTIFSEGEPVNQAYKIISGVVRLCKHLPDGRRQIAQFLFPAEYFSFVAIGDHGFCAEAVVDVRLLAFPHKHIERLCRENPDLRARLFEMLSQRVRDIQNHLTIIGRQTAKERVAAFMLLLGERFGHGGPRIDVPMSRYDIADYLGLTMETVSRTLSLLKTAGIIAVPSSHQLELLNLPALRALADGMD